MLSRETLLWMAFANVHADHSRVFIKERANGDVDLAAWVCSCGLQKACTEHEFTMSQGSGE